MLQPMDLQLLFSQLDTISKDVAAQKEGAALKRSVNDLISDQQSLIKEKSVQETKDENLIGIKDKDNDTSSGNKEKNKHPKKDEYAIADKGKKGVIKDPDLGNYVDLKG
ncbi:MAG: hypothetical protein Ta2F_02540 [Termitinemataceae bacterium]|nr:MAG: hypothetical protein Ta2F_02540 [Termitinemataceae bacterium]